MRFSPSARACRLTFPPMLRIMKAPKGVFFMRHAWLIITHGNFEILEKQLRFLDSENADFFIHVDARVKDFDFAHVRSIPRKSRVTFLDRKPISWGHFSQVDCELRLLCAAVPGGYDYYHLLSGVDVPVKTRQYIENYFSSVQPGTNFVHFQHKEIIHDHRDRVKFYYPLQRWNLQNRIIRLALRRTGELLQRPFVEQRRIRTVTYSRRVPTGSVSRTRSQRTFFRRRTGCASDTAAPSAPTRSFCRRSSSTLRSGIHFLPTTSATTTKPACVTLTGSAASRIPSATKITASLSPRRRSTFSPANLTTAQMRRS